VRTLEERTLLSIAVAAVSGGIAVTATGGAGNDTYVIRNDSTGGNVQIYENDPTLSGPPALTVLRSSLQSVTVNGNGGDDQLVIDFTNGSPLPAGGVTYDGGTQGAAGNTLVLQGYSGYNGETYSATGVASGTITFQSLATAVGAGPTIRYANVQSITDTAGLSAFRLGTYVLPPSFVFNATNGGDHMTLMDGPVINHLQTLTINSTNFPFPQTFTPLTFANKANVSINMLDGWEDDITVNYPTAAAGLGTLLIDGGAGGNCVYVEQAAANVPITITGGTGLFDSNDITIGSGNLDLVRSPITVHGGGWNTTSVLLEDYQNTFSDTYTITGTTVSRPYWGGISATPPPGLTYDGVFQITLWSEAGNNTINVTGVAPNCSLYLDKEGVPAGNDTVNVGNATTSLDAIQGSVIVHAPSGTPVSTATLNVTDQAATAGHAYTLSPTGLTRDAATQPIIQFDNSLTAINLTGTPYTDNLDLHQGLPAVPMHIDLGAGLNTVSGPNTDNVWTIDSTVNSEAHAQLNTRYSIAGISALTGGSGADRFVFTNKAYLPLGLDGGTGENTLDYSGYAAGVKVNLTAGTSTTVLGSVANVQNVIGSAYNDTLVAGAGNGILIGGAGSDTLVANAGTAPGFTILIAGTTDFDSPTAAHVAAFNAFAAAWQNTTATNYGAQVKLLRDAGLTVNGVTYRLNSTSVHDDAALDKLVGATATQTALDWFFANAATESPPGNFKTGEAFTPII
jgi:hypothetical protein